MATTDVVDHVARLIQSKPTGTCFLNGPPQSGKSYLLGSLADQLPSIIPRCFILGPYSVSWDGVPVLRDGILHDLEQAGFVDDVDEGSSYSDLASAWKWLAGKGEFRSGKAFVVLIDVLDEPATNLSIVSTLLSSIRDAEGALSNQSIRVFHMLAGCWDPVDLEEYYRDINTSFPYTVGSNYIIWRGLSPTEMSSLVDSTRPEASPLHGRLFHEITGGHPGAAVDILNQSLPDRLALSSILSATRKAAQSGPAARKLVESWSMLPQPTRHLIRELIVKQRISDSVWGADLERLDVAGVVASRRVGHSFYVSFRSWYTELVARFHAEELGISDEYTSRIPIADLMPQVAEMNIEAYRVINSVENLARDFLVTQLSLQVDTPDRPILKDRCQKLNSHNSFAEDANERALIWRDRSAGKGLPTYLNPLIAFLSTGDLAALIEEVACDLQSDAWRSIARAIQDLVPVRDAIMHNQLIDDDHLERLCNLQNDLHQAVGQTRLLPIDSEGD